MHQKLTEEDKLYLKSRGFEIVYRAPTTQDEFPYIILGEPIDFSGGSEIGFYRNEDSLITLKDHPDPYLEFKSDLITLIAKTILSSRGCNGEPPIGREIKLFVADSDWEDDWEEIAEAFKKEFSPLVKMVHRS